MTIIGSSQEQYQLQRDPKIDEDGEEGETKHNVSFCDQNDLMRSVQTKLFLEQFNQMYGKNSEEE